MTENNLTIPYSRQDINQEDIDAVIAVLRSEFLTQGPLVPAFEDAITKFCNASYAIAVNSATSALHIACLALDVGKGDIVWTTSITFVASANCALYCGAEVDFVDIDPLTYNISVKHLAEKLETAEKANRLPKVIIPVHMCGQPCYLAEIYLLSKRYGFKIIEDASHAIGAKYKYIKDCEDATVNGPNKVETFESIGNCRYSDITVFSFHPVKIITSGEGGMAVTNNRELAKRLRLLRSHGITNVADDMYSQSRSEIWNYQQIGLGFNYRMTDIQAALGLSQINRLIEFVNARHILAHRYRVLLENLPVVTPWQHINGYSSYHLYVIRLKLNEIDKTQREVHEAMRAMGVLVNLHYIPVYRQPYYKKKGFQKGYCLEAEKYYSDCISIPLYPGMSEANQDRVVNVLRKSLGL